jgi:hypothetical protein
VGDPGARGWMVPDTHGRVRAGTQDWRSASGRSGSSSRRPTRCTRIAALEEAISRLETRDLSWWLYGRAALAVRGIEVEPGDIDLNVSDPETTARVFDDLLVTPAVQARTWVARHTGRALVHANVEWLSDPLPELDDPERRVMGACRADGPWARAGSAGYGRVAGRWAMGVCRAGGPWARAGPTGYGRVAAPRPGRLGSGVARTGEMQ